MLIKGTKKSVPDDFLKRFEEVKVGSKIKLPSFMPGVSNDEVMAFCMDKEKNFAQFALYWQGIHCGDVSAEIHGGEMVFEELA